MLCQCARRLSTKMSKLSFRPKALEITKPLPVYRSEELPDLPDYSAINRAVPQLPSGMDKEEECVSLISKTVAQYCLATMLRRRLLLSIATNTTINITLLNEILFILNNKIKEIPITNIEYASVTSKLIKNQRLSSMQCKHNITFAM